MIERLKLRARLNAGIREFFASRGVLEVETPILSMAGNTEPNIDSFHTDFSGHVDAGPRRRWLRTSPEYPLKRLLAAGIGDCYELGRVFRNGEAGGRHNPEFTLLEWYRVGWNHLRLIDETVELVRMALALVGRDAAPSTVTYRELFRQALGVDPFDDDQAALRAPLAGIAIDGEGLSRDDWLDLLFTHRIQPMFADDHINVVIDWPATQAALARIRPPSGPGEPPVAERYELYLGQVELANGYHELADADEQHRRFARDLSVRRSRGAEEPVMDQALLAALKAGFPDCAGVAIGVDRLLMAMRGTARIADVLAYDFAQA